jgi:hypothetical protein
VIQEFSPAKQGDHQFCVAKLIVAHTVLAFAVLKDLGRQNGFNIDSWYHARRQRRVARASGQVEHYHL